MILRSLCYIKAFKIKNDSYPFQINMDDYCADESEEKNPYPANDYISKTETVERNAKKNLVLSSILKLFISVLQETMTMMGQRCPWARGHGRSRTFTLKKKLFQCPRPERSSSSATPTSERELQTCRFTHALKTIISKERNWNNSLFFSSFSLFPSDSGFCAIRSSTTTSSPTSSSSSSCSAASVWQRRTRSSTTPPGTR